MLDSHLVEAMNLNMNEVHEALRIAERNLTVTSDEFRPVLLSWISALKRRLEQITMLDRP